jgi:hypothetical protein
MPIAIAGSFTARHRGELLEPRATVDAADAGRANAEVVEGKRDNIRRPHLMPHACSLDAALGYRLGLPGAKA